MVLDRQVTVLAGLRSGSLLSVTTAEAEPAEARRPAMTPRVAADRLRVLLGMRSVLGVGYAG